MQHFDALNWVHQWDEYEMVMYAQPEPGEQSGVFMQVSRHRHHSGAEEWEILYQRKLADISVQTESQPGSDEWQEQILRNYLRRFPSVVADEKAYIEKFLSSSVRTPDEGQGEARS